MDNADYSFIYAALTIIAICLAFWGAVAYLFEGITPFFERIMHIIFALFAIMILIKCVEEMNE